MTTFDDIPFEVTDKILSGFSLAELWRVVGISGIRAAVERKLFEEVIIDRRVTFNQLLGPGVPKFGSPGRFIQFLHDRPHVAPKRITFVDPFDAIVVARDHPQYIINNSAVKVTLDFSTITNPYSPPLACFVEAFLDTPFDVAVVRVGDTAQVSKCLQCAELTRHVVSFSAARGDVSGAVQLNGDRFPSLTSVRLDYALTAADIAALPKKLTTLRCVLGKGVQRGPLHFPLDIEDFTVGITPENAVGNPARVLVGRVTLRHWFNLRVFRVTTDSPRAAVHWELPENLQVLLVPWSDVVGGGLGVMCPHLKEYTIRCNRKMKKERVHRLKDVGDPVESLTVPHVVLACDGKFRDVRELRQNPAVRSRLRLPLMLKELVLMGTSEREEVTILDFEMNRLEMLEVLSVNDVHNLKIVGPLPKSITTLKICNSPDFDMSDLIRLPNLVNCEIKNVTGDRNRGFSYMLPESLQYLALVNCGYTKAYIVAPRLTTLVMSGNNFAGLTDDTLVIPASLHRLVLDHNNITHISMTFPPHLKDISLDNNRLRTIAHLPDSLSYLSLTNNMIGRPNSPRCVFPTNLCSLQVSGNLISDAWLASSNIPQCTSLLKLFLANNLVERLDTAVVPRSVTQLDATQNRIVLVVGDFRSHAQLRIVKLAGNDLSEYFRSEQYRARRGLFANEVIAVDVRNNGLAKRDVRLLFGELGSKRKFECLEVEPELRPGIINDADSRPRKMQRVRFSDGVAAGQ
ncbi:hypothetical protein Cantr_10345 [Candida viswanathii]|uniref:Uncharacterized protein n=1 Tax=Candida viswanathii TaxID=5486 RepID=A0A367YDU0_9ASCO|nr:hypothetical protein Cantr_10345 [Candida viswanathii]